MFAEIDDARLFNSGVRLAGARCRPFRLREAQVFLVQLLDLWRERALVTVIVDHVICHGESLLARGLDRDDRQYLLPGQPAALHHPGDLLLARTVYHQYPVHPLTVSAAVREQRHRQQLRTATQGLTAAAA